VKALVVEDNPGLRDVVVDLLTRRGHTVAAFPDAESAWDTTHHEVYHLAVLDWGLPGMDGVELCRRLRTRPGGEAGAILILTGRADPEDVDEVVAAGADDYLTKPFKLDWLDVRIAFAERKVAELAARAKAAAALRESELRQRDLLAAARDSERRYRSVVDSVQEVIFQTDPLGHWTFLNPAWTEITGHALAASLGRPAASFIHPDDRDRYLQGLARLVNRAVVHGRSEVRILTADRETRCLDLHARAVLDEDDRVTGISGTLTDVTERRRAEEALRESQERFRHLALHDPLTALPNRTLLLDRLEHAVATSVRHRSGVAVLFLDLDGFKLVNDSLGHDAGDRLLVAVGERLMGSLRLGDTVARLGGDEFAILLEDDVDPAAAETVARRLLDALRPPVRLDGREIAVGASLGVALGRGGEICAADLLRNADIALYEAKGAGRSTFAVYEPRMAARVMVRLQQETDLRWAIDRNELRLHYQPVFDLKSGEVAGVEALIRWQHPELGLLPPAEFIEIAETNGLVVPLGEWALRQACRTARQWQERQPASAPIVGVNLSARQLQEPGLVESVAAALAASGLTPSLLELEITESIVVMDGPAALRTLAALRELGVRLAIDDFGTGYASLTYLGDVPFDALKIDRSFIAGIGRTRSNPAILRATVGLAHDLGLVVTAEGIETLEQRTVAQSLGVDRGQGYYFARPLPAEAIDGLLGTARPAVVNGYARERPPRAAVGA
jgi:diguanylate cyclase (GGDEF)-like protein/PAS domain S-box-containing protein